MRKLSNSFMQSLKDGLLHTLLERVKNDSTLCLDIRNNRINIYYRGGSLMRIQEDDGYQVEFNKKYGRGSKWRGFCRLPKTMNDKRAIQKWIRAIPLLKQTMDLWFTKHPKDEREYQQVVLRQNNGATVGGATDYFIIDIEYARPGARFDLVALEWKSEGAVRKLSKGHQPRLCFIEMKCGDKALSGKSGMLAHVQKFQKYLQSHSPEKTKSEMLDVLKQKRELGLIDGLKKNKHEVRSFLKETNFIFLLADHDPASTKLKTELQKMKNYMMRTRLNFNLKLCAANFMGFGIFTQNVFSLPQFINRFKKQICS